MTRGRRLARIALVVCAATALLALPSHRSAAPVASGPPVVVQSRTPALPAPTPLEVSRAFVEAYASFVYGRLAASLLPDASPDIRRRAQAEHPNPPAAVLATADPRLRSLRLSSGGPTVAHAVAVIDDGGAVYDIALTLHRRPPPGGWTIIGLSETG